ncbi:MAG: hypothetical protein WC347_01085 [Smithellaceae bacterium]|jgi:hypothetical protein
MKKYFSICILTLFAVGLMSSSAFAVVASFDGGNSTIASELITAGTPYTLSATSGNNAYQPAGAVAVSKQIKVSLTGGSFNAIPGGLRMCDSAVGNQVGISAAVALGDVTTTIITSAPLSLGTIYNFQPIACAGLVGAPMGTSLSINAGSTSGSKLYMTVDNYQAPGDSLLYASGLIATVENQFSAALITPASDKIDFAATVPLSKFKAGGSDTTTTSLAKVLIMSNEALGTKVATGLAGSDTTCVAYNDAGANLEAFSFTVTPATGTMGAGFHATAAIQAQEGANVGAKQTIKGTVATTDTTETGNVNLNTGAMKICGSHASSTLQATAGNQIDVILQVTGTTALASKDYKLAIGTTTAGLVVAGPRNLLPATVAWSWGMDATQFYVPFIKSSTVQGKETMIKLQSKSSAAGTNGVSVQVLATDGTMVTFTPDTAAITPGTMYSISGADLIAKVQAAGKAVDGDKGFAAIITVDTPGTDVFAYAQMVNASGEKRIPVQRLNTSTAAGVPTTVAE